MTSPGAEFRLRVRQRAPIPLDAELACHGGELLALVGPSGSGKSTLLRIIAGLARPAEGRIACGPSVWCDSARGVLLSPQQRRVGFVPQHYGLFPHMTALANVMAGLAHLSSPQRERQARDWLAKVHLDGLEQRRPAEMSGGQQQRVALARALARDPAILLLDEPFSAVDRATRETLYLELAELKRQLAIPAILVTHDLTEALLLADRLTLLSHGHTVQSGAPRDVLAHPVNETAARLVGVRNLFDGEILRHDAQAGLTWFRAGESTLACALAPQWPARARVRWMAPASSVRLRSHGGRGELPVGPNRVRLTVRQLLLLGDETQIVAQLPGIDTPLQLRAPHSLVEQLGLEPGAVTEAVLRADGLRILATDDGVVYSSRPDGIDGSYR